MALETARDEAIEALAALCKGAVNAALQPTLGTLAIKYVFPAPLPLDLIAQNSLPALCVYRSIERDRDAGDWIFEDVTTYRFDYYAPATPLVRIQDRWPLLHQVWTVMLAAIREGRDPNVSDNAYILRAGGIARYVLGTGQAEYTFVPGANNTYPYFRAQLQLEGCYDKPAAHIDAANRSTLDDFETLHTEWNLPPVDETRDAGGGFANEDNAVNEAENDLELPQ